MTLKLDLKCEILIKQKQNYFLRGSGTDGTMLKSIVCVISSSVKEREWGRNYRNNLWLGVSKLLGKIKYIQLRSSVNSQK